MQFKYSPGQSVKFTYKGRVIKQPLVFTISLDFNHGMTFRFNFKRPMEA